LGALLVALLLLFSFFKSLKNVKTFLSLEKEEEERRRGGGGEERKNKRKKHILTHLAHGL